MQLYDAPKLYVREGCAKLIRSLMCQVNVHSEGDNEEWRTGMITSILLRLRCSRGECGTKSKRAISLAKGK